MNVSFSGGVAGGGRRVEGAWAIYPNSTLFKAGVYPDKRFSMSIPEMDRLVTMFDPTAGARSNIEHTAFLSGRAARARRIWRDGEYLRGEVAIPAALDDLLIDGERRLSCEFTPDTKLFAGIALTTDPRVQEAVLMSAFAEFARHDTGQGQYALQNLHDLACRHGAVCRKGNTTMSSRHEATAIQQVHDTCVDHGATCASAGNGPAMFAGDGGKGNRMPTLKERINAWFTGAGIPLDEEADDTKFSAAAAKLAGAAGVAPTNAGANTGASGGQQVPSQQSPTTFSNPLFKTSAAQAQEPEDVRRMREELARLATESRMNNAREFAKRIVAMNRALPREEIAIAAAYFQAATDDAEHPAVVTFANERAEASQGTRVEQLDALYKLRTPHNLTKETMAGIAPGAGGEAPVAMTLFNKQTTAVPSDGGPDGGSGHSKDRLLAMSEIGQQVLNGKGGK
jgi:hypothetical protein